MNRILSYARIFGFCRILSLFLIFPFFFPADAAADEKAQEVNNGQDITRPLARLDLRYGYQNVPKAPHGHDDMHIYTLRMDKPFAISPEWMLAT